jgi:hypothetical protein
LIENPTAAAHALLVCAEEDDRELIVQSLKSLAIQPLVSQERLSATKLLDSHKFEAVIVDLRLGEVGSYILNMFRHSPANRTAVSFVILPGDDFADGHTLESTFVLERPLSLPSVTRVFRAAYGLMVRERRRYFRCAVTVQAMLRTEYSLEDIPCNTVNISEGGVSVHCPLLLEGHTPSALRFRLPGRSSQFFCETFVRWQSQGDLVGLEFHRLSALQKVELQEWLGKKLEETLPERVAALFRSVSPPPA